MWHIRGEERDIKRFGWETEGRSPLVRPRRRWRNNTKIELQEIVSEVLTVINLP